MAIKTNGTGEKRVGNFAVENSDKLWKVIEEIYGGVAAIVYATKTCKNESLLEACCSRSRWKVENSGVITGKSTPAMKL